MARISFLVAVISLFISITSFVLDEWLMAMLAQFFNAPASVKFTMFVFLTTLLYWLGVRARRLHPERIYRTESIFMLAALSTAATVYYLGTLIDNGSGHFSVLILLSCIIYGVVALTLRSTLIWLFALLSLGGWFGAETGYASGWGAYYLGMSYPLRFVAFGAALAAIAHVLRKHPLFGIYFTVTFRMGLMYLLIACWILSIFGNLDMDHWQKTNHAELFGWCLLFAGAAAAAIYYGLKFDDNAARGIGITFLLINLYTRYCEYFWDSLHKGVFFAILGASFWYLGSHAEKIWLLGDHQREAKQ